MIWSLALSDLRFSRRISSCIILALCAVLTPLLLIFALKTGVVAQLEQELTSDPSVREITTVGTNHFTPDFFAELRKMPEVSFAVPQTRLVSVQCSVRSSRTLVNNVDALPTGKNEPLAQAAGLPDLTETLSLYLSAELADSLQVTAGDTVKLSVKRRLNSKDELRRVDYMVAGVLPSYLLAGKKMLMPLPGLIAMEDFRDGFEPQIFGDGSRLNKTRTEFPKARIYAADIYSVETVVAELNRQHVQVYSHLSQIENLKAVRTVLSVITNVIALVTVLGGLGALWGLISAALDAKLRSFTMLRLMGFTPGQLYLTVLCEQVMLTAAGFALSAGLCLLGSTIFNLVFADFLQQQTLSFLTRSQWLGFAALSFTAVAALTVPAVRFRLLSHPVSEALRQE